jgi:hypothetical protein
MAAMAYLRNNTGFAFAALLALVLVGCTTQKDTAKTLIAEIDAAVSAAEPEAAKYIPEQLSDVRTQLSGLHEAFDHKDYAGVLDRAPAALAAAQSLATAAAAKKDEILKALNDDWSDLVAAVPGDVAALQSRVEFLGSKAGAKLAKGVDVAAAKGRLDDLASLWSKAQAAFAAGNLNEAVAAAKDVKVKAESLAADLKIELPKPVAVA